MSTTTTDPVTSSSHRPVRRIPQGMRTVTPHLVCARAAEAIDFYVKAFGAEEMVRVPAADGRLMHACLRLGDAAIMLVDEFPEWECKGPKTLQGTPVTIHLYVDDADASAARAVEAGAKLVMPVQEMFWGDRYGMVEDPYGHRWSVATHVRDVTPEELQQAAKSACCGSE